MTYIYFFSVLCDCKILCVFVKCYIVINVRECSAVCRNLALWLFYMFSMQLKPIYKISELNGYVL